MTSEDDSAPETSPSQNPVSRWFTHDWNRAIAIAKLPMLRPATTIVALMPILQQLSDRLPISIENAWLLWFSSLFFAAAFLIIRIKAPGFIQDFADYGAYTSQAHSHRWLLWRFKYALPNAHNRNDLLDETIRKELALPYESLDQAKKDKFPNPPPRPAPAGAAGAQTFVYAEDLCQFRRDICFYFWKDDIQYILPVEECGDPLGHKQKELFWLIFTDQAKARTAWRVVTWCFIYVAFLLLGLSFVNNVWKVVRNMVCGG